MQNQVPVHVMRLAQMIDECFFQMPVNVNFRAIQAVSGQIRNIVIPIQMHAFKNVSDRFTKHS